MKFIHTGDLHIGKIVNGISMLENQEKFLNDLIEIMENEKPDCLVIAGDIYDRSIPPIEAVETFNTYLEKIIVDLGIPVLAIAGNHDSNERLSFGSRLMKKSGYHIAGLIKETIEKVEINGVVFYLIPYFEPAVGRKIFKDDTIKCHEDAMKKVIEIINTDRDRDKKTVIVAHGYVTNINFEKTKNRKEILKEIEATEYDSERPLSMGGTEFISGSVFEGFDYVALGHLHEPKRVSKDDDKIRYAGSPLKYSISEKENRNSVTVVEFVGGETEIKEIGITPLKNIRVVEGELEKLLSDEFLKTQKRDDYIHFILTDSGELYEPMRKLKSKYDNPISLERRYSRTLEESKINLTSSTVQKNKIELFKDFHENVTNDKITEERNKIMNEVIELVEREEI